MDDIQNENREKLKEFANQLKKLSFPTSPISASLVGFVTESLDSYLHGKAKTLDSAFGLSPARGAKRMPYSFRRKRASLIISARLKGESWTAIADELGGKHGIPKDMREIQRIAGEFEVEILSEKIKLVDILDNSLHGDN